MGCFVTLYKLLVTEIFWSAGVTLLLTLLLVMMDIPPCKHELKQTMKPCLIPGWFLTGEISHCTFAYFVNAVSHDWIKTKVPYSSCIWIHHFLPLGFPVFSFTLFNFLCPASNRNWRYESSLEGKIFPLHHEKMPGGVKLRISARSLPELRSKFSRNGNFSWRFWLWTEFQTESQCNLLLNYPGILN